MSKQKLQQIGDDQIGALLSRSGVTVVLMSSPWDGNGVIMRTIVENIAARFKMVNFATADYESSPRLAKLFNLLSPPGLLFVKDGELIHRITKPTSAGKISELIHAAAQW